LWITGRSTRCSQERFRDVSRDTWAQIESDRKVLWEKTGQPGGWLVGEGWETFPTKTRWGGVWRRGEEISVGGSEEKTTLPRPREEPAGILGRTHVQVFMKVNSVPSREKHWGLLGLKKRVFKGLVPAERNVCMDFLTADISLRALPKNGNLRGKKNSLSKSWERL